jgi:hypothetical protein
LFSLVCLYWTWGNTMLETNEKSTLEVSPPLTARERKRILERDQWRCRYCGSQRDLQVDHIFPRSLWGGNQDDNLAVACATCNHEKSNKVGMMPRPMERNPLEGIKHRKRLGIFLLFIQFVWFWVGFALRVGVVLYFWVFFHLMVGMVSGYSVALAVVTLALIELAVVVKMRRTKDLGTSQTLEIMVDIVGR